MGPEQCTRNWDLEKGGEIPCTQGRANDLGIRHQTYRMDNVEVDMGAEQAPAVRPKSAHAARNRTQGLTWRVQGSEFPPTFCFALFAILVPNLKRRGGVAERVRNLLCPQQALYTADLWILTSPVDIKCGGLRRCTSLTHWLVEVPKIIQRAI
jgi:hypothetical protein